MPEPTRAPPPCILRLGATSNPAIVETLLDAGADVTVRDEWDTTPWDLAQDNEALRGTAVYWQLNAGRFR